MLSEHAPHLGLWRLGRQKPDEVDGPLLTPLTAAAGDVHCALELLELPAPNQALAGVAPLPVLPAADLRILRPSILLPVPQACLRQWLQAHELMFFVHPCAMFLLPSWSGWLVADLAVTYVISRSG